ncbi:hypothetical protein FHX64_002163 [Microbacter margulisiae]|uniref:Uncharacterized protein n=1 Tax=Microbacter margulisiae TaxID=1350067 RepID=A0A7W5DSH2_9PORP|nr:hypothetical protein [Microbacter margulisiae]
MVVWDLPNNMIISLNINNLQVHSIMLSLDFHFQV